MYLLCLYRIDEKEPEEGYKVAPKGDTEKCRRYAGPGTKEAPSEEVAPWNTSIEGNSSLSADNRTVHSKGSVYLVNKIHALHVEDVVDKVYRI